VDAEPLLVKQYQSFIDKDSNQPAAENTFVLKPWNIVFSCPQTVLHGIFGLLVIT